ncbi:MAG: P63C domain-containing protein [Gallionella sp.]|nr:P63C domain-containing protein [Gallionella sp.]
MNDNNEPKGRAKGGIARADKLTPEQRSEIAKKGAAARWGAETLKATHKGNFKKDFGIDVECYVLNDKNKTAVISQSGMGVALGLGDGGTRLPRFVFNKTMTEYIWPELTEKINNPIIFQSVRVLPSGHPAQSSVANGYDVTILIDICKAILKAESDGKLKPESNAVKQAHIIVNASAKAGIQGLVYALSGFDRTKEEVIAAFKLYVQDEAKKYESEFPVELYTEWHRLYEIPVLDRGRSWHFKHLTVRHIYYPLAKSNGKILELIRALKSDGGDRNKKLFQFLNDVGARALRMQLGRVLEMSESSKTKAEYENKISERFGGQQDFEF